MYSALAIAHFFAGRHEEAVSWAEMAVREKPERLITLTISAASSVAHRPARRGEQSNGANPTDTAHIAHGQPQKPVPD